MIDRRAFLSTTATTLTLAGASAVLAQAQTGSAPRKPSEFRIACMTLPYSQFPLMRALSGLKDAGYRYVAWGTSHREEGAQKPTPIIASDASADIARTLARRCRDMGLEPLMMFAGVYPEGNNGLEVHRQRILQAAAAGIPQLLTFSNTRMTDAKTLIERFKQLGPIARDNNVLVVFKQHGGNTGTGEDCAKIVREVNHPNIQINYDSGNVMDYYQGKIDPLVDIRSCTEFIHSFCIKDHRRGPTRPGDCGPGLGEIDHYKLLHNVAFLGRSIPLCCENIFAPGVDRPTEASGIDALARRAREFLELVIQGIQRTDAK
jgi:sugar phosphate isomerase/epimerase